MDDAHLARRWFREPRVVVPVALVAAVSLVALGWGIASATGNRVEASPAASPTALATALPTTSASPDEAPGTCTATAEITESWDSGLQANVTVTADADVTGWSVTLDLGDATVEGAWNSTLAPGSQGTVEAGDADYNGVLATGATTTFGFTATGTGPVTATGCVATHGAAARDDSTDESDVTAGPEADVPAPVNAPSGDDWLSVDGNAIVDADGRPVWLTGANWFGFNTTERVLHGLWAVNMRDTLAAVADHGVNVLRVPISTQLLLEWRAGRAQETGSVNQAVNADLAGMTTLEIFDQMLAWCRDEGIKVVLDVHSALADNAGHNAPLWYAGDITEEDFFVAWEWAAQRYRDDDTIVAFDLENEPHGKPPESPRATWGDGGGDDWRAVASEAAARIHAVHPDVLLLVEGIEATPSAGHSWASNDPGDYDITWWGGNLRLAGEHPVEGAEGKIVYSPHDYGPLVFEQPWFQGPFDAASLERDVWTPTWLYLHDDGIAPLLIGEWGGRLGEDDRQDRWLRALRDLIADRRLHHTFWAINPNSSDTGGLLLDDWTTWDEDKLSLLAPALWRDDAGAAVGLDHEVPLGADGVTVTEYYEDGGSTVR